MRLPLDAKNRPRYRKSSMNDEWDANMLMKSEEFDTELADLAEKTKALSHPARLVILRFLATRDTCICGEIVRELPLAQATVSRHLKVLQEAGLVRMTRQGPSSCYCVAPNAVAELRRRLTGFLEEVEGDGGEPAC